ncbi:MAG: hypothetical protein U1E53_28870 [Dongiaceae bacterium]
MPQEGVESSHPDISTQELEFEREKWLADYVLRKEEIALKAKEQHRLDEELRLNVEEKARSRWSNPLVLAIIGAALATLGNAGISWLSGWEQRQIENTRQIAAEKIQQDTSNAQRDLESFKAESQRILEVIKTNDPDRAAANLQFLIDAGLILNKATSDYLKAFLHTRKSGQGPSLPAVAISTGVDQVSDAVSSGYAGLAADRADLIQRDMIRNRSKVVMAPSCRVQPGSAPGSEAPCMLYPFGDPAPDPIALMDEREKVMSNVAVLRDYAHALAAVTNAADRAAYDAAVAHLSLSVRALAAAADAVAVDANVVAPAATSFAGGVVDTAFDQQRFHSLKAAVNAVGTEGPSGVKPIASVAAVVGAALDRVSVARQRILADKISDAIEPLGKSIVGEAEYTRQLVGAQGQLAILNGMRDANPSATTNALVMAHDELVAAVNDPSGSYTAMAMALSNFQSKAAALQSALAKVAAAPGATEAK